MRTVLILLAVLYALSPYDVLPDFLVGWGWLDDLVLLGLLWRYFYKKRGKTGPFQQEEKRQGKPENHTRDPYAVLGLAPGASRREIKQAYRELANKYHPDKVDHLGEEFKVLAEKRFKEIQAAYEALKGEKGT